MTGASYPLPYRIHDICNKLFFKKRKLLEDYGFYKTLSGKYNDGHGTIIDPNTISYQDLKSKLQKRNL